MTDNLIDCKSMKKLKIAVLVSGSGSNLQVMIDAMQAGRLPIEIVGVVSNVADAYAVTRANNAGIRTVVLCMCLTARKWASRPSRSIR